jgi:hypothetical protein
MEGIMKWLIGLAMALGSLLYPACFALAAPFFEVGDAGQIPALAQTTIGFGERENVPGGGNLSFIVGNLSGPNDVDMYLISIVGAPGGIGTGLFTASTVGGAEEDFDTQLFLFNAAQIGVAANDDASSESFQSTLRGPLVNTLSGPHYLAISSFDNDPLSLNGPIFGGDTEEVVGPTGPGGGLPVINWTNEGSEPGRYVISLRGADFFAEPLNGNGNGNGNGNVIPEPSTLLLLGSGLLGLAAIRTRQRTSARRSELMK